MKHIFYLFWMGFIVYEILWLLDAKAMITNSMTAREFFKKNKVDKKEWNEYPTEVKTSVLRALLFSLPAIFLKIVGLLSFQWPVFLVWLVFGIGVIVPINALIKSWKGGLIVLHSFCTVVNIAFSVFVIVNSYHLHLSFDQILTLIRL